MTTIRCVQQLPINKLVFWINAFIPGEMPGATHQLKEGPHAGKTMIFHPVLGDRFGYLTDQRDFSEEITARSRLHSRGTVLLNGIFPKLEQTHKSDMTVELKPKTGALTCTKTATEWTRGKDVLGLTVPWMQIVSWDGAVLQIEVAAEAGDPCTPEADIIAKVDYHGTIFVDFNDLTIQFVGKVDEIPAFEMYAQVDNGPVITIFQVPIAKARGIFGEDTGKPNFMGLIGPANRSILTPPIHLKSSWHRLDGSLKLGRKFK